MLSAMLLWVALSACQQVEPASSAASSEPAPTAFDRTAQGDPVVTVEENGEEKRYVSYDQMEEVVFAPLATEEYSLPEPWMDDLYNSTPAPNRIDGIRIENPNATLTLNPQTLMIGHPDKQKEIDLFNILTGEDYPETHAFFERRVWFYQQEELVTFFFVQMNERTFIGDTHVVQFNAKTDELMAAQKMTDGGLAQVFRMDDWFYLFCEAGETGEYLLYVLQENLIPRYLPGELILPADGETFEQAPDGQVYVRWNDERMTAEAFLERTVPEYAASLQT